MNKKEKIVQKIKELNLKNTNLKFEFNDKIGGCSIRNHSTVKGYESSTFGAYCFQTDDLLSKDEAYQQCLAYLDGLLAGMRLLDAKAYHNIIANQEV